MAGAQNGEAIKIDAEYVNSHLGELAQNEDFVAVYSVSLTQNCFCFKCGSRLCPDSGGSVSFLTIADPPRGKPGSHIALQHF